MSGRFRCAAITVKNQRCKDTGNPFCHIHSTQLHDQMLKAIFEVMSSYISSPWNPNTKEIMTVDEYDTILDEFTKLNIEQPDKLCKTDYEQGSKLANYKMLLCQAHAGNLFDHSQWAALQILQWNTAGVDIMEGVDFLTAYVSAFFHDIGKGGDCIENEKIVNGKLVRWRDMYSPDKYAKQGEQLHPEFSGDMILGLRPFYFNCSSYDKINFRIIIKTLFPDIDIQAVALSAYMHWEFGKLNIGSASLEEKMNQYYKTFVFYCEKCKLEPSLALLKLCIAVSCADIAAGTNSRLLPSVCGIVPSSTKYLGKDPWVAYGMDKKYKYYRDALIQRYGV